MSDNNKQLIDVVIGGKIFKLSAEENPEYIQKIAEYIDNKLNELNVASASDIMNNEYLSIILALNIADDLFKEKGLNDEKEIDIDSPTPEQMRQIAELKTQLMAKINDYDLLLNQFQAKTSEVDGLKDTIYANEDNISKLNLKAEGYKEEAETNKKTIENKSQYIIDLTKKISDKNQELNNLSKKLAEKNSALNELNKKSAERNIKLNTVNKERDELAVKLKSANNTIKNLEKEIENIKAVHKTEMDKLKKLCADEIAEIETNHADEIFALNTSHQNEIEGIRAAHKDRLERVELSHQQELDDITAKNRKKVSALSKKLTDVEIDYKDLEHNHKVLEEDSDALKSEFDKFKNSLTSTTDGQLKAAFAKTKAENIELRRTIEELKTALSKIN
jgi:hypothetical protein